MHLQMHLVHVLEIELPIETQASNAVLLRRIGDPTKFYLLMPHGHRPQYAVDMLNFEMERARRKYQRDETTLPPQVITEPPPQPQAQPPPPSRKRSFTVDDYPVFTPKRKTSTEEDWGFQNTPQTDKAIHRLKRQLDYFIRPPGEERGKKPPLRPMSDSVTPEEGEVFARRFRPGWLDAASKAIQ